MKLVLRRSQRTTFTGRVIYSLEVRAELTHREAEDVRKHRLGSEVLYQDYEITDPGSGLLGLVSRWAMEARGISIRFDDLVTGKRIECKDILEMRAIEGELRQRCEEFKGILETAVHFEGEDITEF